MAGKTTGARRAGTTAKGEQRKVELADHALRSIATQSYARTSMRDIATAADINLGRLHYYFEDKADLIVFTVRHFKETFVATLRDAIEAKRSVDAVMAILIESATTGADLHRFWYDLRNQALFEPGYRIVVGEIEDELKGITAALLRVIAPDRDAITVLDGAYGMLDSIFFRSMQASLYGDPGAGERMKAELLAAADLYQRW